MKVISCLKRYWASAALSISLCCVLNAVGETASRWTWPADGTGDSALNMADWMTAANWDNGVPNAYDRAAFLTNSYSGIKFVKIPTGLTLWRISGPEKSAGGYGSANRQIVVCDNTTWLRPTSAINCLSYLNFYGDVSFPKNGAYTSLLLLAGDIIEGLVRVNSAMSHRLDLYAKQAGGVRTGFLPEQGDLSESWGDYVLYAPRGTSADIVGQWSSTAGSPYLVRTGAAHDIPVGTTIHGEGIPAGAWVKRIFAEDVIEISAAATATVTGEDITFDQLSVNASAHLNTVSRLGAGNNFIKLNKYRPEDVLRLEIDNISNQDKPFPFKTDNGFFPGTFVLHNLPGNPGIRPIVFHNCHLEFAPATGGNLTGMPYQGARLYDANSMARLTVSNGVSASILTITNLVGTVVKDGAGSLAVDLSRTPARNTGKLVVEAGEFKVVCEGTDAYVKTLVVSNGATVCISGGNLKVDELILEPGSKIKGPGHVLYPQIKVLPSSMCEAGGAVEYTGPGASVNYLTAPTAAVVGTPALWVDVAQAGTVTYDPETLKVSALTDVRGAGYMTAAVPATMSMPTLVTNADGTAQHIYFACKGSPTTRNLTERLDWSAPLENIRVIFKVVCAAEGGGNLLGSTTVKHRDFWRDEWTSSPTDPLFFTGTSGETVTRPDHVTNGVFYVNGERRDWHTGYGYRGGGGTSGKATNQYVPLLAEYHVPAPGGWADCFSYVEGGTSRSGKQRLYELIVYTNELSQAERQAVAAYLMNKYRLGEVDCSESEPDRKIDALDLTGGAELCVGAETALRVGATSGEGALVKDGPGTLYVDEFANADGALKVAGGKLVIRSLKLDSAMAGTGAYLHLDALNEDSVKLVSGNVDTWQDTRGAGYLTLTNFSTRKIATVTNNCLNGKRMVDLNGSEGSRSSVRVLAYEGCDDLRSVFLVTGTRKWGGSLIGHLNHGVKFASEGHLYGLWRRACGRYGTTVTPDSLITSGNGYDSYWLPGCSGPGATHARVNGEDVDPLTQGVTHNGDIVSLVTREDIYGDCLSCAWEFNDTYYYGGQQLGEYLLFRESLSQEHVRRIEAYLRQKWFGEETVGYRAPKAASVSVAAGATLELAGGEKMTVSSLSGAGTINGPIVFAADSVLEVPVAADGSVPAVTVSGTVDLSAGGVVRLTGYTTSLQVGVQPILIAPGLDAAALAGWSLVFDGKARKGVALSVTDGKLELNVNPVGFILNFR